MPQVHWLKTAVFFKSDGEFREKARELLAEVIQEQKVALPLGGCWTLPGKKANPEGYRIMEWDGRSFMGHRFVYQIFHGPIPKGKFVLHSCDNPPCCNPEHLRAGTLVDNYRDMRERGTFRSGQAAKTHCPQGHAYDEANTKVYENRRYCRACHKIYSREYQRRRRADNVFDVIMANWQRILTWEEAGAPRKIVE